MRVIERSPIGGDGGANSITDRATGIWRFGWSWDQDIQAQSVLVRILGDVLDNTYTMISNVALPRFSLPVPLVLVGPTGVRTIYTSAVKGIFRVKGENWYKLAEKDKRYKIHRPNLVRRTELMSRAIIDYLGENGIYLDDPEAVLFFAQPGVHIDAPESPIRLLHVDGVTGYAATFNEEKTVLDAMEIHHVVELLTKSKPSRVKSNESFGSLKPPSDVVGYGDFKLKVWQWILLFILAVFMLITVIVTAVIIVGST
ncbi:MAG: hypothetical protein JSV69_15155 [Chloroflexota bacterium]|nr:MAG: hypothetical protein JSV69_15155 [Chloroflexota bacterium]